MPEQSTLKSQIRNIRTVYCGGAFGDSTKMGAFVYGLRPDGKTVRCKSHWDQATGMTVESRGYVTQYTRDEWLNICSIPVEGKITLANKILDERPLKP